MRGHLSRIGNGITNNRLFYRTIIGEYCNGKWTDVWWLVPVTRAKSTCAPSENYDGFVPPGSRWWMKTCRLFAGFVN